MEPTSHEHSGPHLEHLKPEVDQFFRQEGLSEEHWQRIYDLRYCSILVPLVDNTGKKKHARQDTPSPKRKSSPPRDMPHLPTPTITPRADSRPHASSTGRPTVAPPPPIKYLPKDPEDGQEGEEEEARPFKKRMLDNDHARDEVMETDGDEQGNMSEDSFHDALDTSEAISSQHHTPSPYLRDPSYISMSQPSSTVGSKRQRESATPTPLILQQRTPSDTYDTGQNPKRLESFEPFELGVGRCHVDGPELAGSGGPFQGPSSYRSYNRSATNPYPVHRLRRNWTPQRSVSPAPSQSSLASSSSSFVRQRTRHFNQMDGDHQPLYQIKSVFKRKMAAGLKTVGELIPFWKEVENGKTDIKEEVVVPLVKAPKVQSMIESFEYLDDLSSGDMEMIRQDEETMSRRSSLLSSHSSSIRSVAEMISEGHARRVSEAEQMQQ
ncbi:hypothetical protein BG006_006212 [Podila minutissima]|uniref:Uncharacterized protein n=1 Tax=Podila minutissima TaxID=64525 RepID=A0A9P5VLL2_9FUNG|nr:hypothetical protein BG006_006212 [Podila minutissima]